MEYEINQWEGCYDDGWQGDIIPEAFSHPAKFSRGLIHRIYKHAKEMGWFKPGDYVLDPFGGVALGGLDAMGMGLNWRGIELEWKFVALGRLNIALWNRQLDGWPNLGTAWIVQGDSRRLLVDGCDWLSLDQGLHNPVECLAPAPSTNLKADLVVSSPPFESCLQAGKNDSRESQWKFIQKCIRDGHGHSSKKLAPSMGINYGKTEGQIGATSGDTFWASSKIIVQGCYELLKSGGEPVPNGNGIDFCGGH